MSYESILEMTQGLPPADSDDDRVIEWCEDGPIGVGRDPKGRIELFLEGPELPARLPRVRESLDYQRWYREGGQQLLASRLVLPAAGHYEQVAAFLCTELLREGAKLDLTSAFVAAEPLIELAIGDLLAAEGIVTGLSGELLLLRSLLDCAPERHVSNLLQAWKGHRNSPRDFQIGVVGVEVKTTTESTSSHLFAGLHQLEMGHGVDGQREEAYFVASFGLEWLDPLEPNATTLPEIVDGIIARLQQVLGPGASNAVDRLLDNIRSYGPSNALAYDHTQPAGVRRFSRPFQTRFVRGYDMRDDAIRLLTTGDLRERPFLDPQSLRLRVNLPARVRGDANPVAGMSAIAARILGAADMLQ